MVHLTLHITPRPEQYGFWSEHSTTLQLSRVLHHLTVTHNRKEHVVAVFLDMEEAFDWAGLIHKLTTSQTPRRLIKVLASFLQDRRFRVSVEDSVSTECPKEADCPSPITDKPTCANCGPYRKNRLCPVFSCEAWKREVRVPPVPPCKCCSRLGRFTTTSPTWAVVSAAPTRPPAAVPSCPAPAVATIEPIDYPL